MLGRASSPSTWTPASPRRPSRDSWSTSTPNVPAAIDEGAALFQRFDVAALSTLIVIDGDGKVTFRATEPDAKTITAELVKAGA